MFRATFAVNDTDSEQGCCAKDTDYLGTSAALSLAATKIRSGQKDTIGGRAGAPSVVALAVMGAIPAPPLRVRARDPVYAL